MRQEDLQSTNQKAAGGRKGPVAPSVCRRPAQVRPAWAQARHKVHHRRGDGWFCPPARAVGRQIAGRTLFLGGSGQHLYISTHTSEPRKAASRPHSGGTVPTVRAGRCPSLPVPPPPAPAACAPRSRPRPQTYTVCSRALRPFATSPPGPPACTRQRAGLSACVITWAHSSNKSPLTHTDRCDIPPVISLENPG